jgi:hypothetical protein
VLRFFDDQLAEANRELSRDLRRFEGGPVYGRSGFERYGRPGIQRVVGRDADVSRREVDDLTRLRYAYAGLRGRYDQGSLEQKWQILQQMIALEKEEVRRDRRWLRGQGWQDPLERFDD